MWLIIYAAHAVLCMWLIYVTRSTHIYIYIYIWISLCHRVSCTFSCATSVWLIIHVCVCVTHCIILCCICDLYIWFIIHVIHLIWCDYISVISRICAKVTWNESHVQWARMKHMYNEPICVGITNMYESHIEWITWMMSQYTYVSITNMCESHMEWNTCTMSQYI